MTISPKLQPNGVRQLVTDVVGTVLERDGVDPSIDLFDQGLTSLAFIRVVARLNEQYEVALDVSTLDEASIDSLSALLETQLHEDN
jgi:aryl carrier-like protein